MQTDPLLIVGGGNMARAIIRGARTVLDPSRTLIVEPDDQRRAAFDLSAASIAEGLAEIRPLERPDSPARILLAVKPQKLAEVAGALSQGLDDTPRCIISILAGTTIERLRKAIGDRHRYIRVMPNTPAQIGRGMSAITADARTTGDDRAFVHALFDALGCTIEIPESHMDAFTAIAGSGPAYAFYLAEAMLDAALQMGFAERDARLIVSETLAGAGLLLAGGERDASALRAAVTSPGGTTAAALRVMDDAHLREIIVRALMAARDRGRELARL